MNNITTFIESGILESYVLGNATPAEVKEVEQMSLQYAEVREEIELIRKSLEDYAKLNAVEPNVTIKPMLLAFVDYTERMQAGEAPSFPPVMNESTKVEDFSPWLNRSDMLSPGEFDEYFAKIISYTPEMITAIAWIKTLAPAEAHDDEHEKFLIVEGTCDIIVEDDVYHMVPGSYFQIPLHKNHVVKVTSMIPCKLFYSDWQRRRIQNVEFSPDSYREQN